MNPRQGSLKKIILPLILLSVLALPASPAELSRIEFQYELRRIGVDASDLEESVEAVWTHALGVRFPLKLGAGSLQLVPGVSFTTLYYFYDEQWSRAVPTDVEWRELTALVPLLDTSLRWRVMDWEKVDLSVESGLGVELPIPVKSWERTDSSGEILPSLYSKLRFIRPIVALQADMPLMEQLSIFFRLSAHFPISSIFEDADVGIMDGFIIGLSSGFWFR